MIPEHAAESAPRRDPIRKRILGVGIAALDIINDVERYPHEDSEVRAIAERRVRGGNCANTLSVLAGLGHACRWVGTLGDDAAAAFIDADLRSRGIETADAARIPGGSTPTSYCVISRATASRTIVHYRDLPELDAGTFERVPLAGLDWIHLEGRNPGETAQMIRRCRRESPGTTISVELEKPRPGIERLLEGPDLLLISRGFAEANGAGEPGAYLQDLATHTSARLLVLGWGALGAWLLESGAAPILCPAELPGDLVDTLGAGDVLNAGVIDGALNDMEPRLLVTRAVRLAGLKCTRRGLDGLAEAARESGIL